MDIEKLLETTCPSTNDRKVFQYPFLFDVDLDEGITQDDLEAVHTWNCDMVLECLEPLSCEVFRKAFVYDVHDTNESIERNIDISGRFYTHSLSYHQLTTIVEPLESIQDYYKVPSLDSIEWTISKEAIRRLDTEMQKLFHAEYVVAGRSFTDSVLKFGNIGNYYLQYLANGLFGHPNAVMAIHNRRHIIDMFSKKNGLGILHSETAIQRLAEQLFLAFVEVAPERWIQSCGQFPFSKGDIMECMIQIRGRIRIPKMASLAQTTQIQTVMKGLFYKSTICDDEGILYPQKWKVRFVLI